MLTSFRSFRPARVSEAVASCSAVRSGGMAGCKKLASLSSFSETDACQILTGKATESLIGSVVGPGPFVGVAGRNYSGSNKPRNQDLPSEVDVLIVGGGITGSALLYSLAEFTDLQKVLLIERRNAFAQVASGPNNNSQTIHCGDIETNYTIAKAAAVKRQANLLRNFVSKLPHGEQKVATAVMQKMAIGVGEKECEFMEKR
ncbi:putative malate:quinone oxidoreductase [Gregarina niphandrodes]|uniref:Malate:quinone oxidoreductase n=1 Tax=Gregarina niphandrodes TaxID=110365 RepID=A0A023B0U9_GRENI|nr:putative malate:quinone oxidoreductase [Gregarina niphandrodes]EZG45462.1 putative malate:quinone oxidoreductase [Gregarina niphandrodes]|eukprot:XP_011132480.1 putative malate:quinone oxidoreductase [Gregarina niphandrodes]